MMVYVILTTCVSKYTNFLSLFTAELLISVSVIMTAVMAHAYTDKA